MKKVFTLVLAMTIVITSFAQIKSVSRNAYKPVPAQKMTFTGMEERDFADFPAATRAITTAPEETELSFTTYDSQTNAASRNFTAVWPDGFAVMCYTQATTTNYSDRGTGLAIWDPEVGEWEYTETHAEDFSSLPTAEQKTGFGSISRWGQNGLVICAHSSNFCHLFFCENFRNGDRDFSTVVTLPNDWEPTWPSIQCSGPNLDILHILATQYTSTDPIDDAIRYWRYENGAFTADGVLLESLNYDHMGGGGSNITNFLPYDPAKPNRVAFVVNDAWVDGKVVVSEDNGATWDEIVFYQHPGIHTTFEDSFHYPRWSTPRFNDNDELYVVYEWNGSTGEPASGTYYPTVGGVGFWSETLPKNAMCIGGIGEVGQPFIMDSCYMGSDLYHSEWYWSDALHDPLPEYFGELQILDGESTEVVPYDGELPDDYIWVDLSAKDNGGYNSGIAAFPSMFIDGNKIYAFWSMICGEGEITSFIDNNYNYMRLFACTSDDGGRTWSTPVHILTDFMTYYNEMVWGQVIPYVYRDDEGDYLWYVYQMDGYPGTAVMGEEDTDASDCYYSAVKVYIDYIYDGVEENNLVAPATTLKVYPNPAQGSFHMELNQESDVNIYNVAGQLVKTYKNVKNLNVDLEAGIYFVKAGNETQKVVVF